MQYEVASYHHRGMIKYPLLLGEAQCTLHHSQKKGIPISHYTNDYILT